MAELEYEFTESGLSDLRSDMEALAGDTEAVGDEATSTAAEMESAASSMEESVEDVQGEVEELQDALSGLTTRRAQRALENLEDAAEAVDMGSIATQAATASAAIESEMADAEGALQGVSSESGDAGDRLESSAQQGIEEYEDLTQQVLATRAAIRSVSGGGITTDFDANVTQQTAGGGGLGVAGAGAAVAGKEALEQLFGSSAKLSGLQKDIQAVLLSFRSAVKDLTRQVADTERSMDLVGDKAREVPPAFVMAGRGAKDFADEAEEAADDLDRISGANIAGTGGTGLPPGAPPEADEGSGRNFGGGDDDDDSFRRRGGGLMSVLPHELEKLGRAFSGLVSKAGAAKLAVGGLATVAVTAGTAAAALNVAASAAAGGLTALATKLAMDHGTQELQNDLEAVKAQFKETASLFVEAFAPVIRGTVIPILQTFNKWLRENIDELKSFAQNHTGQLQEAAGTMIMLAEATQKLLKTFSRIGVVDAFLDWIQELSVLMSVFADAVQWVIDQIPGVGSQSGSNDRPNRPGSKDQARANRPGPRPGRGALASDKLGTVMNTMAKTVARIRGRANRDMMSEEEMLRSIVSARETAFQELQKLNQKYPDLISQGLLDHIAGQIKDAQKKLEKMTADPSAPGPDVSRIDQVTELGPSRLSGPSPGLQAPGLGQFESAAKAADSIGDINSLIKSLRANFDTAANKGAQLLVAKLQKAKDKMQETKSEAKLIGDALARSVARSADRVFNALGQGISDAIFGGGSGRSTAQARLNLFNAKEQVRSLRESLRKGNLSYRNFQLKMAAQQNKIQQRQEQLNDSMQSGFAQAAESMVGAFQKVAKQLIAEITAVIAKMAVLKAVTMIPGLGQAGGFAGAVISNLGGGAFLEPDSGASGGMVKQSGLAVIHENEQIMNAETVSMLDSLLQPSTPSAQPAAGAGGGMNVTVQVQGETTTDGRDLKTAYDQTTRIQRRKGRRE
ncbi:dGTP triphosphohydrolase [Salinibacter ruber]|uniref:hypothetical protein n=1 Tax=Salinibacter ruber TaxID=146919 RepID=UPI002169BCF8|nr:hypothetical protein [Salinibacter ruber]MCS4087305.1 dGTP triphosphohydrolase [Salinibacter ruber]